MYLAWCCKCKSHIILSSCCPLNTNCYKSEDQSETMHNMFYIIICIQNYKDIRQENPYSFFGTIDMHPCSNIPTNSVVHPNFKLLLIFVCCS